METSANTSLRPYGILQEKSDVRAHLGIAAQRLYVFQTKPLADIIQQYPHRWQWATAGQQGVSGTTGGGYKVPWNEIPDIRVIALPFPFLAWPSKRQWDYSTSEKGEWAVRATQLALSAGIFPLWLKNVDECQDKSLQILGTDIIVNAKCHIQTKCDWWCGGPKEVGCTGNIFIQTHECNPYGLH